MATLDIAIPTYNRKDYLRDCLISILNQSFLDYNIYIFDNASDYDMKSFLNEFKSDKIFLISSDRNRGHYKNFEKICSFNFKSPYVMIFHDDDALHPEYLKNAIISLKSNNNLIWVGSGLRFIKDSKKINNFDNIRYIKSRILDSHSLVSLILNDFDLCFDSVVYRNIFPIEICDLEKKFGRWMDRPLLVELSKKGEIKILFHPFVNYRIHKLQGSQDINSPEAFSQIKNLYYYYYNLSNISKYNKQFLTWSTNAIFLDLIQFARNLKNYFSLIKDFKKNKLFNLYYLRPRGIFYFLIAIRRLVVNRILTK